jgi:hypothetical protein
LPACHAGVVPLDHDPVVIKWTAGESNPDYLVASQESFHWTSSPCRLFFKRSARELNPTFRLTTAVCRRNTCRPFLLQLK